MPTFLLDSGELRRRLAKYCIYIVLLVLAIVPWDKSWARPPLGLTFVESSPPMFVDLQVIGPSAYLTFDDGVWAVDSSGAATFIAVSHPDLGTPTSVTRVVDGPAGDLYAAANFTHALGFAGAALYRLDSPNTPIVTWPEFKSISGVSSELRILGNCDDCDTDFPLEKTAAEFFLDGSVALLPAPDGSIDSVLGHVSSTGHGLGWTHIPGTLGTAPALWTPDNEFSFIAGAGSPHSIRDRLDNQGVNIGFDEGPVFVKYGSVPAIEIRNQYGGNIGIGRIIVSHSDFAVVGPGFLTMAKDFFGYYPGIVPGQSDRARPLLEVFPELSAVDIESITDLAAVDGYIYMTIIAGDGLYLFGARDPSVIPEPTSAMLLTLAFATMLTTRRCA